MRSGVQVQTGASVKALEKVPFSTSWRVILSDGSAVTSPRVVPPPPALCLCTKANSPPTPSNFFATSHPPADVAHSASSLRNELCWASMSVVFQIATNCNTRKSCCVHDTSHGCSHHWKRAIVQ